LRGSVVFGSGSSRANHALAPPAPRILPSTRLTHHQGFTTSNPWALCCAARRMDVYCGVPARPTDLLQMVFRTIKNAQNGPYAMMVVSVIVAQLCGQTLAFNWQFTLLALRPAAALITKTLARFLKIP